MFGVGEEAVLSHTGFIISIEGQDTKKVYSHIRLLEERLKAAGLDAHHIPSKDTERLSTYFVNQYKRGSFGKKQELGPYMPALFYGLDRFALLKRIAHKLQKGSIVIIDRSLLSDMRSSAHLLEDSAQRLGFYTWLDVFSQQVLQYQKPDYSIYLENTNKPDEIFSEILKLFPKYIDATIDDASTLTQNVDTLWSEIQTLTENLPKANQKRKKIEPKLEPLFSQQAKKAFERYAQKYSDQIDLSLSLNPQIITHATVLLESAIRTKLSNPRQLQSLESYNTLLEKDVNGNYKYYTPHQLDSATAQQYEETMNSIFETIKSAKNMLEEQGIQDFSELYFMLPLATRRNYVALQDIGAELRGMQYDEVRQFIEPKPQRRLPKDIQTLLDSLDTGSYSTDAIPLKLISYAPNNETAILPYAAFSGSTDSITELSTDELQYTQKAALLRYALREHGVLQEYSYVFEVFLPVQTANLLQETLGCQITSQAYVPRHGYVYPEAIEKYDISDQYERCFDVSYELYSTLQAKGYESLAPYATLLGHKQRSLLKLNGEQLVALIQNTDTQLEHIRDDIITHLTPVHPYIISSAQN